jgi:hypothetical protein
MAKLSPSNINLWNRYSIILPPSTDPMNSATFWQYPK